MKNHVCFLVFCCAFLCFATCHGQVTVADWQRKAVADFPDLAVSDSKLNREYVSRYNQLKTSNPSFFAAPKWPYTLAQIVSQTPEQTKQPPTPAPAATIEIHAPEQLATAGNEGLKATRESSRSDEYFFHEWSISLDERGQLELSAGTVGTDAAKKADLHDQEWTSTIMAEDHEKLAQVFAKFLKWEAVAKKNSAQPFEKPIAMFRQFSFLPPDPIKFSWGENGASLFFDCCIFQTEDIQRLSALLREFDSMERELKEKRAKANNEAGLFK